MKTDPETQEWSKCPDCNGEGWSWQRIGGNNIRCECHTCEGEGEICNISVNNHDFSQTGLPSGVALERVVRCAERWWQSKRPYHYDFQQHLANPTINCVGDYEKLLAEAVAAVSGAPNVLLTETPENTK